MIHSLAAGVLVTSSSPPTRRVVEIIELLTQRRDTSTRLSDIVKELDLNQATAYAIMKELVDTGWVTRDPDTKAFAIGAALVGLIRQIDQSALSLSAAAQAATADTGYATSVSERVGNQLIIVAFVTGANGPDDQWDPSVGDRLPFAAPFGPAFAAWEPDDERRAWIRRSGVNSPAFHAQLEQFLDDTSGQGFSVERLSPEMVSALPVMTRLQSEALSDSMRHNLDQVLVEMASGPKPTAAGRQRHYVGSITAPVFNSGGRVTHNIGVHPFADLSARKIEQIGHRLRRLADAITAQAS
jgi:DNA-binding IclR family transcriptional regulator